jgi:hypothetical protein
MMKKNINLKTCQSKKDSGKKIRIKFYRKKIMEDEIVKKLKKKIKKTKFERLKKKRGEIEKHL